jgi:hypothetical protein
MAVPPPPPALQLPLTLYDPQIAGYQCAVSKNEKYFSSTTTL